MTKNIFKFVIAISLLLFSNTYAQTFLSKQNPIEKIGSFYFESVSDIISSLAKDFDSTLAFYKPLFLNTVNVYSISANNIYDSVKLSLNRVSDLGNLYIRGFNRSQESAIFAGVSSVNIVAGIGDGVLAGVTKSLNSAKDAIVLTIYSTNKIGELVLNGLDNASGSTIYAKRQIENIFASIDSKGTDIGKNFALAIKSKNNINDQNTYVTRNKKKLQRIELTSSTSSFWNGLIDKISDPLVPLFVEKTKVTKSVVEKENSNPKENSNQSEIIRKENVVNNPSGNIVNNYYTNNYLPNSDLSKLRFEYLSLYKNLSDSINTRQLGQTEAIYRSVSHTVENISNSDITEGNITNSNISGGNASLDSLNVDSNTLVVDSVNNRVGIATTSPFATLSVAGDIAVAGGIYDNNSSLGNDGYVLQSTSNGVEWVATSTLGITGGGGGSGTVTSVDISVPTGLSVSGGPVTTSGTIGISLASGYNIPLTASTTAWNAFYNTPSSVITAGTGLSWSGNTLNSTLTSSQWTTTGSDIYYNTGNVGIGTSSPSFKLDIKLDTPGADGFRVYNSNGGSASTIQNRLENNVGSYAYSGISSSAYTGFAPINGGRAYFGSYNTDTSIFTQTAHDIIFSTNGANERVRIDSSGNVGIGTSDPGTLLHVNDSLNTHSSDQLRLGSGDYHYAIGRNNTTGFLDFNGNQTGYTGYYFGGGNVTFDRDTVLLAPVTTITPTIGGNDTRIEMLSIVNNTDPTPLVIYFHGNGEDQNSAFTSYGKGVVEKLISQGYIVASSYGAGNNWGNQESQDAYVALYDYLDANYNISKVIFIGQSMGALSSLNIIKNGTVPVDAWYGIVPATNLSWAYNNGWSSYIEDAYGFSGAGNYAAATSGYDPYLADTSLFSSIRFRFIASPSDTSISKSQNSDLFSTKISSVASEYYVVSSTGNHGDASGFNPPDVYEFTERDYVYDNPTKKVSFLGAGYFSDNLGIGTSTPNWKLSVAGIGSFDDYVRASYFVSTSTATSTFAGGIQTDLINVTSTTATSTFANGINLNTGCFAVNGTCLSAGGISDLSTFTTDDLTEGLTNLYYTDARSRSALSSSATGLSYDNGTGIFSLTSGYNIPLTASTTAWNAFYNTPSSVITAGTGLSWSGNTLNSTLTSSQWSTNSSKIYYNVGNVGIGTSDPNYKLDISQDTSGVAGFRVSNGTNGAAAQIQNRLENNAGSVAYYGITATSYSSYTPINGGRAFYGSYNTDTSIFTQTANNIIFSTNGTENMRLKSGGNLGIGTTSPNWKLSVAGIGSFDDYVRASYFVSTSTTLGYQANNLTGGATNLTVDANGNIIRDPSDRNLKKNIETIDGALAKVLQLRGVSYEWKDIERFGSQKEIGVIAQEVETVVPEVVSSGGEYKSVNIKNLVGLLIEAIKDLAKKVEALTSWFSGNVFRVQGDVCVDDVCVSKAQFKALLQGSGNYNAQHNNSSNNSNTNTSTDTGNNTSTTTSTVEEDTTEDTTNQPEDVTNNTEDEGGVLGDENTNDSPEEVVDTTEDVSEDVGDQGAESGDVGDGASSSEASDSPGPSEAPVSN